MPFTLSKSLAEIKTNGTILTVAKGGGGDTPVVRHCRQNWQKVVSVCKKTVTAVKKLWRSAKCGSGGKKLWPSAK